ncbi:MAG: hypothetical protein ACREX3_19515, partial [Gammaproteobacteria bacterium]
IGAFEIGTMEKCDDAVQCSIVPFAFSRPKLLRSKNLEHWSNGQWNIGHCGNAVHCSTALLVTFICCLPTFAKQKFRAFGIRRVENGKCGLLFYFSNFLSPICEQQNFTLCF